MNVRIKYILHFLIAALICLPISVKSQTEPDDYYLGHGFNSGETVITNSGTFYDAGGNGNYGQGEDWTVTFCSENGNPITLDFTGFATHYGGPFPDPPEGEYANYDYMNIDYPGASYVAYHDDTPQFSFTSAGGCITFRFRSQSDSPTESGWEAEISAIPPPPNNDPCTATELLVGNSCTPTFYNNKGAYNTTDLGSPSCHTYFGGDVWFSATVPASGQLKIETFAGTLDWSVMVLYDGPDCDNLSELTCDETSLAMPTRILSGRTPGETIWVRIFGDQAKSGTFGICASDPTAPVTGSTGPAGVGDKATNDLWLRADQSVLNSADNPAGSGEDVQTWQDHSGNQNHLTQSTASQQPEFQDNVINNLPVVRFDGVDEYLSAELSSLSAPVTFITVTQFSSSKDAYVMTLGDVNSTQTASISRESDDRYYCFTGSKRYGPDLDNNQPYIVHAAHDIASPYHNLYLDDSACTVTDYGSNLITDGSLILGASRNIDTWLHGDLAEVILYNQLLNEAQKIIVENSLSAKYGISLSQSYIYSYESTHSYDVAGIGRVDADNIHTNAQSARTLSIGGAADLENNEFLLFGHDNGNLTSWTGTEQPNGDNNIQRIEREWRVNIIGGDGMGPFTLSLNDSLMPAFPPGFLSFNLWVDSDGNFSSGATAYPVVLIGDEYVANNVPLNNGDYITVGVVQPVVRFITSSSEEYESVTNPAIQVSLNYAVSDEVSIQYSVFEATATSGTDYMLADAQLNISPGSKTADIVPLIYDDSIPEIPDEYIKIKIYNPSAGLLLSDDTVHTFTILNDDIEIDALTDTDTISNCLASSANLSVDVTGTGPYTYSWTPTDSLSDPAINNPVARPSITTWYYVTVTDQTTSAEATDSVLITVIPGPVKPTVTPGDVTTFCEGDSVTLTSSAGSSYLWSSTETTRSIVVRTGGSYTVIVYDEYGCESPASDPVVVTVNPLPARPGVTPDSITAICAGDSVELTSSAEDAYNWSTGATSQNIWVKTAGDYYVSVTNSNGCTSPNSDTTTVLVNPLPPEPSISADGPTTFCVGDSVELTSTSGASYTWSNGATDQSIVSKNTGKFSVQVTDPNGCTSPASDTVSVVVNALPGKPTISADGPTAFCDGDNVELTSSPGSSYLWSNGSTDPSITVTTDGDYSVVITDANGCESPQSDQTTVTVNSLPAKPGVTADGATSFCDGDSVKLTADAATKWLWSNGDTTQSITVKIADDFTVQVTDANGCTSVTSDVISTTVFSTPATPVVTAGGDTAFCDGDSLQLTAGSASTWHWSTGETTQSIRVKTAGSFRVMITDANGCASDSSDAVMTSITPAPPAPTITVTGDTEICQGESTLLSSSTGITYLWSTGETTQSIAVSSQDSYSVTVTGSNGCSSPSSTAQMITVNDLPAPPQISGDSAYCEGGSATLQATPADRYLWSNGDTTQDITVMQGSYTLTVTDANGCTSLASEAFEVTEWVRPAQPVITGANQYCEGNSATLSASTADQYLWSNGDVTQSVIVTAGSYYVKVTDARGCESLNSDTIEVSQLPRPDKPVITPDGPLTFWKGDSVVLVSSAATGYLWSPGNETTARITVKTSGTYSVVVTDENGCQSESSDPAVVTVNALDKPEITAGGPLSFCSGGSVQLTSEPAVEYLWSTGDTTQNIYVAASGDYSLIVYNELGHESVSSDILTVTVFPLPVITYTAENVLCSGRDEGSIDVTVTGGTEPFIYDWSNGGTTALISSLAAGAYSLTVTDLNSCTADTSMVITEPEVLQLELTATQPECLDSYDGEIAATVSGGVQPYDYLWSSGEDDIPLSGVGAGTFSLTVTDANNCTADDEVTLVPLADYCLFIPDIITPNGDGYNDVWELPGIEYYPDAVIEVYDRWGKRVFYSEGYEIKFDGTFDGSDLPMDSYHYIIDIKKGSGSFIGNITIIR